MRQPSIASRPRLAIRVAPVTASDRALESAVAGAIAAWLLYTRLYFSLHPQGLTFDPSLFMWLTGRPDPVCGLTRTFAYIWVGDVREAVLAYPVGPLLFIASLAALVRSALVLATGQRPVLVVSHAAGRAVMVALAMVLLANWAAKLVWLGM